MDPLMSVTGFDLLFGWVVVFLHNLHSQFYLTCERTAHLKKNIKKLIVVVTISSSEI